jgi:putative hemolysin
MHAAIETTETLLEVRANTHRAPHIGIESGPYTVRLAATAEERAAAFRLRFRVFNLELNEGLPSAYADGYDVDRFDQMCDHLIVQDRESRKVIGTYRLQMGDVAASHYGYYSEQEFDFSPFETMRSQIVELGRACIDRDHRSSEVLHLLWRGIARYVLAQGGRYMIGCCSLSSLDPALGHAVYRSLHAYKVEPALMTRPTQAHVLPQAPKVFDDARPPKLLRAYLTIGARICSEPAIDREFKTTDFLTLLDLQTLHPRMATRFLESA